VILAGDVGGTKCNLALFSEKDGKLTAVFKQRFASKDFAQFDLIVREFSWEARISGAHPRRGLWSLGQ
jgi:glucokinase